MKRRAFIVGLGSAAAWPGVARAQQPMPVIGFLSGSGMPQAANSVIAFHRGLKEVGFVGGQNVTIEYRWADGEYERLPAFAADLVRRQPAVIVAAGNAAAQIAKAATTTIPITFTTGDDPIATGLVNALNRPSANITGATMMAGALPTKRLEVLHDLMPAAKTIDMLVNPNNANAEPDTRDVQAAIRTIGMQVRVLNARTKG